MPSLRKLVPWKPDDILNGPYGDWITIILLSALFIAVAGIALPKHLTEKRYGKALVTIVGIMLGLATYKSMDMYNFSFESFGFLAIWIMLIIMGLVFFGLAKMGFRPDLAFALTYCVMFLTFWFMTPSLYDAISESLPLLNGIFLAAFLYLAGNLLLKIFRKGKSLRKAANGLRSDERASDNPEVTKEFEKTSEEERELQSKTLKLTKLEIKSVEGMKDILREITTILKEHPDLREHDKNRISKALQSLASQKSSFEKALQSLKNQTEKHKLADQETMKKLKERARQTTDKNKRSEIEREYLLERKKHEIFEFLQKNESTILQNLRQFEQYSFQAVESLRNHDTPESKNRLEFAYKTLESIESALSELKKHEKYIIKADRKEERLLLREAKGK